jgi:hypothetical protein
MAAFIVIELVLTLLTYHIWPPMGKLLKRKGIKIRTPWSSRLRGPPLARGRALFALPSSNSVQDNQFLKKAGAPSEERRAGAL